MWFRFIYRRYFKSWKSNKRCWACTAIIREHSRITQFDVPNLEVSKVYLNGPGKLCKYLGINISHNKCDLINNNEFFVGDIGLKLPYSTTTRIDITKGTDKLWRYVVTDITNLISQYNCIALIRSYWFTAKGPLKGLSNINNTKTLMMKWCKLNQPKSYVNKAWCQAYRQKLN